MGLKESLLALVAATSVFAWQDAGAQTLTGALIGTARDEQGGALAGARVRLTSPALVGGVETLTTNEKGQLRFPALPPGSYTLEVESEGFATYREPDIVIGVGATIERNIVLTVAAVSGSVIVEGNGSRIDARDPGVTTRFGLEDLRTIPTRRASMFDFIRAAPGASPTSPGSGTNTTTSAFGSGTNENQFLIDGTNFTCPCAGIARAEPGVDFIQEIHLQSVGASAEFGNVQGAVINVVTRQGGDRFAAESAYYSQPQRLTAEPVRLPIQGAGNETSGYNRARYRDLTASLGGPLVRDRIWFFSGYQYLRDYDSQPGTDPSFPRRYEQNKTFGKLTWRLTPKWRLVQSLHHERWLNPGTPTRSNPVETTVRMNGTVPAVTFADLTHMPSSSTYWDLRVGRFVYDADNPPSSGDRTAVGREDQVAGVASGAPRTFGTLRISRATFKTTLNHYRPDVAGADHQFKVGLQLERGGHDAASVVPGGVRYIDRAGQPYQGIWRAPSVLGGLFVSAAVFASNEMTIRDRVTLNAGVRYDHSQAISPDRRTVDLEARRTDTIVGGAGTLYTWNVVSPRLGITARLTADGRTLLRASYGRFSQGMLTAEYESIHPGLAPTITREFEAGTGAYTLVRSVVDSSKLRIDPATRAPRTDEYSIGLDRQIGRRLTVAMAYVGKRGGNFIGWTDIGGQYQQQTRTLAGDTTVPVLELVNDPEARRFLLTNPSDYRLAHDGVVIAVDKRRSHGWQAFGSYTFSTTTGLQSSSGTTAAGEQVSSVVPPGAATFGRDPNDLTNATGRLPNDRPHMAKVMASVDIPRTGVSLAANLQYFTGKPWARTAQVPLKQANQRILLEPRGSRRLPSQSLLNLRLSRTITSRAGRIDLLLDVLNVLNDTAEEGLVTDNYASPNFGLPSIFMDPRRAMIGIRIGAGR